MKKTIIILFSIFSFTFANILNTKNAFESDNDLNIKGSDVVVNNSLDIFAKNLNVEASQNSSKSSSTQKSADLSVGLYGDDAGKVDATVSKSNQDFDSMSNKNSSLTAKDINLNVSNDATFKGANVTGENINANIGNNLSVESLQNISKGSGDNKSLSLSTKESLGVGYAEFDSNRKWVDNQTTIIGNKSVNIEVGNNTHIKGGVIASGSLDDKGNFQDNSNLNLSSKTITYEDIKDKDNSDSYNVNLGYQNSQDQGQNSIELGLNSKDKEQTTYATIGQGNITTTSDISKINRDVNKSQVITKDEEENLDIYLSNTSIDKALNPSQTLDKWKQDAKDLGLTVKKEIESNLPSSKDEGVFGVIGKGLEVAGSVTGGLIPSRENQGGYISQIATQLFGDNRTGIIVDNKDTLLKAGVLENDIQEVTLVRTTDGVKKAQDLTSTDIVLDSIVAYQTNPDKTVVILDNQEAIENEKSLSNHNDSKVYLTQDDVKNSGINHVFTNGMLNDTNTAAYNQQTQQNNADSMLNYNQTHGLFGDLMESVQDAIAVNLGLTYLGTGGARQTGNLIDQMATINDGNLTVGGHSQGTLMSQVGMEQNKDHLSDLVQSNPDSKFQVGYAGSPVNHNTLENLVNYIYGGEAGIQSHIKEGTIDDVARSNVNPQDTVGSFLGWQSAGVNNSENLGKNIWESLLSSPRLFGVGGDSTHSYYPCVIGCGNENTTPKMDYYVNPNSKDGESLLTEYYKKNFTDKNGNLTINMDLLPKSQPSVDKPVIIDTTGGNK